MSEPAAARPLAGWLEAVVFDFDGTIADTESIELEVWAALFAEHGQELTTEDWLQCVGTRGAWSPLDALVERTGGLVDLDALHRTRRERTRARHAVLGPRDGIAAWIHDASAAGLGLAIASSSDHEYLVASVARLGFGEHFTAVVGYDDVGAAKPDPASFRAACAALGVDPSRALAVEDSAHGVAAARAAGLRVVACPGPVTAAMDLSSADLVLDAHTDRTLAEVAAALAGAEGGA